jgi:hypothetical protein
MDRLRKDEEQRKLLEQERIELMKLQEKKAKDQLEY